MGTLRGKQFVLPGVYGLNTQSEIADDQALRFAATATNGVIDSTGKLTSREDFVLQNAGGSGDFETIYTHVNNDGTEIILSAAVGKIYSGTSTLTSRYDYSGTSTTLNSWQFASLSSKIFGFQKGIAPFVLNESTFAAEAFTGAPWSNSPNVILAASGRLFAADDETGSNRYTLWWSNLLDGKVWNAGDAGNINLQKVWPKGQDSIIAVAIYQDRLVIFGRNNILFYTLPADRNPANMTLTDTIAGLGCMARDSVIVVAGDIYFLSDTGYYKIPRLATAVTLLSLVKISKLVGDLVNDTYSAETLSKVRAGYHTKKKWLVLNAPVANKTFVWHLDRVIPEIDVPAVTYWTNVSRPFLGFAYDKSGNWYCSMNAGIGKYTGFTSDGASSTYTFDFYTQWNNLEDETRLKHLKAWAMTLSATAGQTGTWRWKTDYDTTTVNTVSIAALSSAEFTDGLGVVRGNMGRSCKVAQFGFTFPIAGTKVAIHSMRIFAQGGMVKIR